MRRGLPTFLANALSGVLSGMTQQTEAEVRIEAVSPFSALSLSHLIEYRDLLLHLVRREFLSLYQQTLLGPAWLVLQPLLSVAVLVVVFSRGIHLPTAGLPATVFYLSGLGLFSFFSQSLLSISGCLKANAPLFNKVYFPRLILPLASLLWRLNGLAVHVAVLLVASWCLGLRPHLLRLFLFLPVAVTIAGSLALGVGLAIAALTVRHRDLQQLVSLVAGLWLYATPILYPLSQVSPTVRACLLWNPLVAAVEGLRAAGWSASAIPPTAVALAAIEALTTAGVGLALFSRVEGSFVDDV